MPNTIAPLEYVDCDLCGSNEQQLLYRKKSRFRALAFSICRCKQCGLIFTNPRIPASLVDEVYSLEYYDGVGVDTNFKGETEQKADDAKSLVRCLEHALASKRFTMLDVGGGSGLVTLAAIKRGHNASMTDLSKAAIDAATAKGMKAYLTTPEKLAQELPGTFDVVVSLEVIEHVYSPKAFLWGVHKLLKPGGLFVFTTGNVGEIRFKGNNWGYFNIPEAHLYFFSTATMNRYLREAGFQRRISPYPYFFKRWWGIRLLDSLGFGPLPESVVAHTLPQKMGLKVAEYVEIFFGRQRFAWARKKSQ